ncbi:hypothetical protein BJ944DRAFT_263401 [Cunninghamella echinulata]|nr:hypothetical protein BJ944DRAFT_263401 [Cunninghamella echinulata]
MDRNSMIIERVKTVYMKLDDITLSQSSTSVSPTFYSLMQIHRMLSDMYFDQIIDVRELYDVLTTIGSQHGFHCAYSHAHQDYVVKYMYDPQLHHHLHPQQPSQQPQQSQHHHQVSSLPSTNSFIPSSTPSQSLATQALPSFLSSSNNSHNNTSAIPLPNRTTHSSFSFNSMSPPSFSSISSTFNPLQAPTQSLPPLSLSQSQQSPYQLSQQQPSQLQLQQQQQQQSSSSSSFNGITPIFGALS